jgi:hypothetical protein
MVGSSAVKPAYRPNTSITRKRSRDPARGAKPVGQLDGAGDAGAEADPAVRTIDVVVHGLGDGHDVHAVVVEPLGVAEGVAPAEGNQRVDTDVCQVGQDILGDVVDRLAVAAQVLRNAGERKVARPGS